MNRNDYKILYEELKSLNKMLEENYARATRELNHRFIEYEKLYIDNKILKNSNNRITSGNTLYNKKLNKLKEYVNSRIEEFKNAGSSRKEIKAHQYYMLLCDIEEILNSSL